MIGVACTVTQHGGRIERRTLTATTALVGYSAWPGLRQALKLERRVLHKAIGRVLRAAVAYAITSLPPQRATPAQLLALWRRHWSIEIVQAQMTKAGVLAARGGGDDIADLDLVARDHHAVDEQFDQLPLLRERRVG